MREMRLKIGKKDEYFQTTSAHGCLVGYKTEHMTWEWTTGHEFIGFTVNDVFAPCLYTDFTLTCPGATVAVSTCCHQGSWLCLPVP